MSITYELIPLDTLFFRGSTPMEAGQNIATSLFPPPISVLVGAFRTESIKQSKYSLDEYLSGTCSQLNDLVGSPDEEPPFEIEHFFIKKQNKYFMPAPTNWYVDSQSKPKFKEDFLGKDIIEACFHNDAMTKLHCLSSAGEIAFVRPKTEAQSLTGVWISLEFLHSQKKQFGREDFLLVNEIYSTENRIGIGLDSDKHTIQGQLYSASHIRLLDDVSLCITLSKDILIETEGTIQLGGEKRICFYKKQQNIENNKEMDATLFVSSVPVVATEKNLQHLISSNKLYETAGWDLAKGFHKASQTWIPAGAVFNKKLNTSCIALRELK